MATMRGVAPFDELWERRTTIEVEGEEIRVALFARFGEREKNAAR